MDFALEVPERHCGMCKEHARSAVLHDCFNAVLCVAALAFYRAVLAVTFVIEGTCLRSLGSSVNCLPTFDAKTRFVFCDITMEFFAIHATHGF